jgi:hypothetical protein
VGFFTAPKEYDVLQIFLPLCALCGVCARSVLTFFFQAIIADGYRKCASSEVGLDTRSIPKSVGALERLSDAKEVLVIGKCASSDGVMHVYRAAVGGEELVLSSGHHPALQSICEVYELLRQSYSALPVDACTSIQGMELFSHAIREELRRISQFDTKALQIRAQHASLTYKDDFFVDVAYQNEKVRYCITTKAEAAEK